MYSLAIIIILFARTPKVDGAHLVARFPPALQRRKQNLPLLLPISLLCKQTINLLSPPSFSFLLPAPRRPPRGKAEPCRCGGRGRPSSYAACGQKTESQQGSHSGGGREERDSFSQRIRYHKGNWSRECLFPSVHCARACVLMILCASSSSLGSPGRRALLPSLHNTLDRCPTAPDRSTLLSAQSASLLLARADFVIAFSLSLST